MLIWFAFENNLSFLWLLLQKPPVKRMHFESDYGFKLYECNAQLNATGYSNPLKLHQLKEPQKVNKMRAGKMLCCGYPLIHTLRLSPYMMMWCDAMRCDPVCYALQINSKPLESPFARFFPQENKNISHIRPHFWGDCSTVNTNSSDPGYRCKRQAKGPLSSIDS